MPKEKRGLGKGLEALIPAAMEQETPARAGVSEIPVSSIVPNPRQPRQAMQEEALKELADSIREHGVIQPIVVTRVTTATGEEQFRLIAGERRWAAARLAGLERIPAVVKEATAQQTLELALVENLQRADLNPLEAAQAYRQLIEEFGLTQEQVAEKVGKNRATVTNTLRLLRLPAAVRDALLAGGISEGHARPLLSLPTDEQRLQVLDLIGRKGLSVRQTEDLVARLLEGPPTPALAPSDEPPETRSLLRTLEESLGEKVQLVRGRRGGKLVIHFHSDEELDAICQRLLSQ